jgi:hypothetical protein
MIRSDPVSSLEQGGDLHLGLCDHFLSLSKGCCMSKKLAVAFVALLAASVSFVAIAENNNDSKSQCEGQCPSACAKDCAKECPATATKACADQCPKECAKQCAAKSCDKACAKECAAKACADKCPKECAKECAAKSCEKECAAKACADKCPKECAKECAAKSCDKACAKECAAKACADKCPKECAKECAAKSCDKACATECAATAAKACADKCPKECKKECCTKECAADCEKECCAEAECKAMCPVSGKAADKAVAVAHNGGKVYLCCPGCPGAFKKNTAKYTAKANHQLVVTGQAKQVGCPISGGDVNADTTVELCGVKVGFCCNGCKGKAKKAKGDEQVAMLFGEKAFKNGYKVGKAKDAE